jgi:plasmid stability protein
MPVNLSIKNAPDEVVKKLKGRAARHHRSLQGELMAIIEAAAQQDEGHLTPREALAKVRAAGVSTPSDSVRIIRAGREGRDVRRRR